MKNLNTNLKSAKFKVSEKYILKYFGQAEKIFIFSSSFFIFIFELFEKFYSLNSSTQDYLSNEVLLLIISFYLQEQLTKMYELPIFFIYSNWPPECRSTFLTISKKLIQIAILNFQGCFRIEFGRFQNKKVRLEISKLPFIVKILVLACQIVSKQRFEDCQQCEKGYILGKSL